MVTKMAQTVPDDNTAVDGMAAGMVAGDKVDCMAAGDRVVDGMVATVDGVVGCMVADFFPTRLHSDCPP